MLRKIGWLQSVTAAGIVRADVIQAWKACWESIGSDEEIPIVEAELVSAQEDEDGTRARVLLHPTVRINSNQYRGSLNHVRTILVQRQGFDAPVLTSSQVFVSCTGNIACRTGVLVKLAGPV
jgi:hypothetical protein